MEIATARSLALKQEWIRERKYLNLSSYPCITSQCLLLLKLNREPEERSPRAVDSSDGPVSTEQVREGWKPDFVRQLQVTGQVTEDIQQCIEA